MRWLPALQPLSRLIHIRVPRSHLLVGLLSVLCICRLHGQTATFKFLPALNQRCVETQRRNIRTEYSETSRRPPQAEVEITVSEKWFQQRDADYLQIERVKSCSGQVDGRPYSNPMSRILEMAETTNVISSQGRLLHVLGTEYYWTEAQKVFPTDMHSALQIQLSTKAIEKVAMEAWNDATPVLVGHTVTEGEAWTNRIGSDPRLHYKFVFPSVRPSGSNIIVTVLKFGSTDPQLLSRYQLARSTDLDSEQVKRFLEYCPAAKALLKVCSKRIIQANTMRILSDEEVIQTTTFEGGVIKTETERDTTDYKYASAVNVQSRDGGSNR